MYRIVKYSEDERRILFRNTSQKMNIHEAIIEKDFWVCLILDYLFHKCEYSKVFTFKGGTSLSKCYGLIHRFSEDIDLILDWRTLGYTINEPWKERSSTKQDAFNKEVNHRAEDFLRDTLLPILKKDITILNKYINTIKPILQRISPKYNSNKYNILDAFNTNILLVSDIDYQSIKFGLDNLIAKLILFDKSGLLTGLIDITSYFLLFDNFNNSIPVFSFIIFIDVKLG